MEEKCDVKLGSNFLVCAKYVSHTRKVDKLDFTRIYNYSSKYTKKMKR